MYRIGHKIQNTFFWGIHFLLRYIFGHIFLLIEFSLIWERWGFLVRSHVKRFWFVCIIFFGENVLISAQSHFLTFPNAKNLSKGPGTVDAAVFTEYGRVFSWYIKTKINCPVKFLTIASGLPKSVAKKGQFSDLLRRQALHPSRVTTTNYRPKPRERIHSFSTYDNGCEKIHSVVPYHIPQITLSCLT